VVFFAGSALLVVYFLVIAYRIPNLAVLFEVWCAAFLLCGGQLGWGFGVRRSFNRWVSELEALEWSACLFCGYPLLGLPSPHDCPECGTPYNLEGTVLAWKNWARTGKLPEGMRQLTPPSIPTNASESNRQT
jgi:hypothetical protein